MNPAHTLEVTTPSERELVMVRVFDAPSALVFDALTQPDLLKRWYGPKGWSLEVCQIDLRVGGSWRFVTRRDDGRNVGQRGVYRQIAPGKRLVNTESWEDWNPGELLVTTVLEEHDGRTTLTNTILFPSAEVRDMLLKSGMDSGAEENYQNLAELLLTLL